MKFFLRLLGFILFFNCNHASNSDKNTSFNRYSSEADIQSGYLEVPENRTKNNGKTIKLAYIVLKAKDPSANKKPILYLQGGPGGATLFMSAFWENNPLRNDRDIVLMDQRGTGESNAICADFGSKLINILAQDLSPEQEEKLMMELTQLCKNQANEKSIDLSAYNSRENAADHEALRKHLGYKQWNLYGGSYGARLGLTIMRDFPESVRTATLFAMFPPNANLYDRMISSFKRSLYGVFNECSNDPNCNSNYPNIKSDFFKVFNGLINTPYTFSYNGSPFVLNAQDMLLLVHQMLYNKITMGQIPQFIKAIEQKNDTIIRQALQLAVNASNIINFAMYMSVNAHDEIPFSNTASFLKDLKSNPEFNNISPAYFSSDTKITEQWHHYRAKPIENKAVVSSIPTLIANGELDPITPPVNALRAKETLSNSYYKEFKNAGHSFFSDCFFDISKAFLDNPSEQPNMSCADRNTSIRWN